MHKCFTKVQNSSIFNIKSSKCEFRKFKNFFQITKQPHSPTFCQNLTVATPKNEAKDFPTAQMIDKVQKKITFTSLPFTFQNIPFATQKIVHKFSKTTDRPLQKNSYNFEVSFDLITPNRTCKHCPNFPEVISRFPRVDIWEMFLNLPECHIWENVTTLGEGKIFFFRDFGFWALVLPRNNGSAR